MEDLLKSWLDEVMAEELKGNALVLLEGGMPLEQVAEQTGLTVEKIRQMQKENEEEAQQADS